MKLKYLIILIQLVLICQSGICQKSGKSKVIIDDGELNLSSGNLELAKFQINDIKARGIIVRLKTNKDRIAAYRKAGNIKVANEMEEKAKSNNLLLMYAFITEWSYSPVYFMESQNTMALVKNNTLIAKTYDLKRDTSISVNADSVYIVDYGEELRANESDEGHPFSAPTHPSSNPVAGMFLVVKDHEQQQLQPPMPYFAKLWLEEFTSADKLSPISLPADLAAGMAGYLDRYPTITELMRSDAKATTKKFLDSVYYHLTYEPVKDNGENKFVPSVAVAQTTPLVSSGNEPKPIKVNPFQSAAKRLNQSFIEYYCKRLDKDKNILGQEDPYYWWQRNPNIRYLLYLHDLEVGLKKTLDKNPNPTK